MAHNGEDPFGDFVDSVGARFPDIQIPWLRQGSSCLDSLLARGSRTECDHTPNACAVEERGDVDSRQCSLADEQAKPSDLSSSQMGTEQMAFGARKRPHVSNDNGECPKRPRNRLESIQSPRVNYLQLKIHTTCSDPAKQQKKAQRKRVKKAQKKTRSTT